MKNLTKVLADEQIQLNRKPAIKIQIQEYDYPAASTKLRYSDYDWTSVMQNNAAAIGVVACCAYDGSLLMTCAALAETASPVVRFPNPTPDTDYTAWATALGAVSGDIPTPYTFVNLGGYDMKPNPLNGEVLIVALTLQDPMTQEPISMVGLLPDFWSYPLTWGVKYKRSTDNGITWTNWVYVKSTLPVVTFGSDYTSGSKTGGYGGSATGK
jgi:hypothetical protein